MKKINTTLAIFFIITIARCASESPNSSILEATPQPLPVESTRQPIVKDPSEGLKILFKCSEDITGKACAQFDSWCEDKKATDCYGYDLYYKENKKNAPNFSQDEGPVLYQFTLDGACKNGSVSACSGAEQFQKDNELPALQTKVKCGMTKTAVQSILGSPDSAWECNANESGSIVYEAYRYGRYWVGFKLDGAYVIINHGDFHSACLEKDKSENRQSWSYICADK